MVCVKMMIIGLKGTEKSSSKISFILRSPTGINIRPPVIHSAQTAVSLQQVQELLYCAHV